MRKGVIALSLLLFIVTPCFAQWESIIAGYVIGHELGEGVVHSQDDQAHDARKSESSPNAMLMVGWLSMALMGGYLIYRYAPRGGF